MKNSIKIYLILFIVFSNCYVGTQRDACRYELKKDGSSVCEPEFFAPFALPPRDGNYQRATENATVYLVYCLQYYEKLKDCDKDNNRFKPGLYGILESKTLNDFILYKWNYILKYSNV
jgi:hypothetical protein